MTDPERQELQVDRADGLEELFSANDLHHFTWDDNLSGELAYRGFGDTFMVESKVPGALRMAYDTEFEKRAEDDPSTDTLGSIRLYQNVDKLIYIGGLLQAGIDGSGNLVLSHANCGISSEDMGLEVRAAEKMDDYRQVVDTDIKPLFFPKQSGFRLQGLDDIRGEPVAATTVGTTLFRGASNFILGRLLQYQPYLPFEGIYQQHLGTMPDIQPRYEVKINDSKYQISNPLTIPETTRKYFLVYHDRVEPTVHYMSNSHATWRALLAIGYDRGNTGLWCAKGMLGSENSTDSPLALQKSFSVLADTGFAGQTSDAIHYIPERALEHSVQNLLAPKSGKIAEARMLEQGITISIGQDLLSKSESSLFTPSKKPDFSRLSDSWEFKHPSYGRIEAMVVPSTDMSIEYLVLKSMHNGKTQHWIATAQYRQPDMTTIGLPKKFVDLPDILMKPPIDYVVNDCGDQGDGYDERRSEASRFDSFAARSIAAAAKKLKS